MGRFLVRPIGGQNIAISSDDDNRELVFIPEIRALGFLISNAKYRPDVFKGTAGLRLRISALHRLLHRPHKEVLVPPEFTWVMLCSDMPPPPALAGDGAIGKFATTEEYHPTVVCLDRPDLVINLLPLSAVLPSRHGSAARC